MLVKRKKSCILNLQLTDHIISEFYIHGAAQNIVEGAKHKISVVRKILYTH